MKQAGDYVPRKKSNWQGKPTSAGMDGSLKAVPPKLWTIWQKMSEIYGTTWRSMFGNEPSDSWVRVLKDIPGDRLAIGLLACAESPSPWPPTLGQFKAMCAVRSGPHLGASMPRGYCRPALPGPVQRMTREEAMAKMRAAIGEVEEDRPRPKGDMPSIRGSNLDPLLERAKSGFTVQHADYSYLTRELAVPEEFVDEKPASETTQAQRRDRAVG